jgi:hypothetical protein
MTDTTGINDRAKAVPKKIEPTRRLSESLAPVVGPGERAPSPEVDVSASAAVIAARDQATRQAAIDAAVREHIESLGPEFRRQAFGSRALKLSAPKRAGFHRHWFNDKPGRVATALAAGYKIVHENGKPIERVVGTTARGEGQTAFLMEIPEQWHRENLQASQQAADEVEATIRRNEIAATVGSNRYVPREGQGEALRMEVERPKVAPSRLEQNLEAGRS